MNTSTRDRWLLRLLASPVVVLLLLVGSHQGATASAADQPAAGNLLEFTRVTMGTASPTSPPGSLRFETQVEYRLGTAPNGFLLLFVFEDNEKTSSEQTSGAIPIRAGNGRVTMDIEYMPGGSIQRLTLLVGMFTEDRQLLGWAATNPLPLASWVGRYQFEQAIAARLAGSHARAVAHLSRAIQLEPRAGNFYYWRADTCIHLGEYDQAILDYTSALELMPEHRASRLGRGIAWLWKEQWQEAATDLTGVLEDEGGQDSLALWAHRARGIAYASLGLYSQATDDYVAYLDISPEAPDRDEVEGWIAELQAIAHAAR